MNHSEFQYKSTIISHFQFQKVLILPGTDTYDNWKESPVPIYDNLFLFNITNPHGFNHGEKAVLKLVGPFVYRSKL